MRTSLIRAALALGVVLAVSGPVLAQSIIRGTVVDAQGEPIEGATITIASTNSNRSYETDTNDRGEFMQIGLASGEYNMTAVKGDLKQTLPAEVSLGDPLDYYFQLTPTSGLTQEDVEANNRRVALSLEALAAMNEGRNADGIRMFGEILAEMPTCGDCHFNMALGYFNDQQYADAEASFLSAIELMPDSDAAYSGLANAYTAQEKFDLAQQASAKASELGGAGGGVSAPAAFNQGVIAWNAGDYATAKTEFETAIQADPSLSIAYYQLGMANLNLGQIPEAREAFEGYLEADPNGDRATEVEGIVQQLGQ